MNTTPSVPCTRCGHLLFRGDGAISPTEGFVCPECGLRTNWERLDRQYAQPWFVESHFRRAPFSTIGRAILSSFTPGRFWRRASLHDDPISLKTIIFILMLPVIFGALYGSASIFWYRIVHDGFTDTSLREQWRLFWGMWFGLTQSLGSAVIGPLVCAILMPVLFMVVSSLRRHSDLRNRHLMRVMFYSLVAPIWLIAIWCVPFFGLLLFNRPHLAVYLTPYGYQRLVPQQVWLTPILLYPLLTIAFGVFLSYWWFCACRSYFRLRRSFFFIIPAFVLSVIGGLAAQLWVAMF